MTSGRLVCSRRRLDLVHVVDGVRALACMASPVTMSERSMVGLGRVRSRAARFGCVALLIGLWSAAFVKSLWCLGSRNTNELEFADE